MIGDGTSADDVSADVILSQVEQIAQRPTRCSKFFSRENNRGSRNIFCAVIVVVATVIIIIIEVVVVLSFHIQDSFAKKLKLKQFNNHLLFAGVVQPDPICILLSMVLSWGFRSPHLQYISSMLSLLSM